MMFPDRGDRMVRRVPLRGAVSTALLSAAMTLGGCATHAVWEKWKGREDISSIGLEVQKSDPDEVEVGWRALVADGSKVTGVLTIDPALEGCTAVEVLVAQRSGPPTRILRLEQTFETRRLTTSEPVEEIWSAVGNPLCKVLLVFRPSDDTNLIAVSASWQPRASVSVESIGSQRQPAWLALLPAAVVADTAAVIMVVPIVICLGMGEQCGKMLNSIQRQ